MADTLLIMTPATYQRTFGNSYAPILFGGDQQALRQETANALDEEGCPPSAAGADPGVE